VRLKGGLGNQLFEYAAARRLALQNAAELAIDDVTGFIRDSLYRRQYALGSFNITARKATAAERLEPFERYRRGLLKWLSRRRPFAMRHYLEQEGFDFDPRLLTLKVEDTLYLDGYWQSEQYFKDIEDTIVQDLAIKPPDDDLNRQMAEEIGKRNSVALHLRWFDVPGSQQMDGNAPSAYYRNALAELESQIADPHYFLFSDQPEAAKLKLALPDRKVTLVKHNQGDANAYADLWLMTQCRHFIMANSTFSWWASWLGRRQGKIVICPQVKIPSGGATPWNYFGQIPSSWLQVSIDD